MRMELASIENRRGRKVPLPSDSARGPAWYRSEPGGNITSHLSLRSAEII